MQNHSLVLVCGSALQRCHKRRYQPDLVGVAADGGAMVAGSGLLD
jgi:hypothetical protein